MPKQVGVRVLVIVLGSMLYAGASYAQAADNLPRKRSGADVNALEPIECGWEAEYLKEPYFEFDERTVAVPEGVFLLIRKGRELGAIRFTELHLDYGGPEGGWAEYESFYQADGSGSLVGRGAARRVGRENMRRSLGFFPFIIERGRHERVQVGPWQFGGLSPGVVQMYLYGTEFEDRYRSPIAYRDPGFEFAATSARDVNEIDARDRRLTWFRYVEPVASILNGPKLCMSRQMSLAVSRLPK